MSDRSVDLAPRNPYGLSLATPLLPAPGCAVRELDLAQYGAYVSRTATIHTRHDPVPRIAAVAGGLVVSSFPTVSIRTLLREEQGRWERLPVPVLVSLQGDADDVGEMTARLEQVDIAGIVIQPEGDTLAAVRVARAETPRPLLVVVRSDEPVAQYAAAIAGAGADALVVAGTPRAAAPTDGGWDGWLIGPAALPLALQALRSIGDVDLPLIALGGITTAAAADAAMVAGASAVMVDAARWGDIAAGIRIAEGWATPS